MDAYLTDENDVQIVDEDGTPYVIGSTSETFTFRSPFFAQFKNKNQNASFANTSLKAEFQ